MLTLGLAAVISIGLWQPSRAAAFPNSSAAVKAAVSDNIIEVRGFRGGGGMRGGGMRGGGMRGGHFAGGRHGGGRWAGGGRYGGGRYAGGRYGGRYAGAYRGYGGYYGRRAAWGAAAVGAAAVGAAAYNYNYAPYYNSYQCGYAPYPPCP